MEQTDTQALNLEMLGFAGFTCSERIWSYPDGSTVDDGVPFFPESLDACFKWLVPKLEPLGYDLDISNDLEMLGWSVCLHNTKSECSIASPMEHCELDGIALALCLVIEKLIKEER